MSRDIVRSHSRRHCLEEENPNVMKKLALITAALAGCVAIASAETLLSDGFESGLVGWTDIGGTTPAVISTDQAHSGTNSAFLEAVGTASIDAIAKPLSRSIGTSEVFRFSFWLYDTNLSGSPTAGRNFAAVRATADDTITGTLAQIYAIGKYNSVDAGNPAFSSTKYQCRVAFGGVGGWMNMDEPGVPSRSIGWHKFTIELDATHVRFYVDDILGNVRLRGTTDDVDFIVLGSALSSQNHSAYYDDILCETVVTEVAPNNYTVIEGDAFDGDLASLAASDDNRLRTFSDSASLSCEIEVNGTTTVLAPTSLGMVVEAAAERLGLAMSIRAFNYESGVFNSVFGSTASATDTTYTFTFTGTAGDYVGPNGELATRIRWTPINDEDPSQDGWLHALDKVAWSPL